MRDGDMTPVVAQGRRAPDRDGVRVFRLRWVEGRVWRLSYTSVAGAAAKNVNLPALLMAAPHGRG